MNIRDYLRQDSKKKKHQILCLLLLILGSMVAFSCIIALVVKHLDKQAQVVFIPVSTISFSIYWMYFLIYRKPIKIAAIAPAPNTSPISVQELNNRIERINQLKLKHKLIKDNNVIVIVYDTSRRILERYGELSMYRKITSKYRFKLDPVEKRVLFQYKEASITKRKDKGKMTFYRGKSVMVALNMFGWYTNIKNPFIIENGELQVSDKKLRGDGMEHILNLLMEIVTGSGWKWQPVFFLKENKA